MQTEKFHTKWRKRLGRQYIRVIAQEATPHSIALGASIGVFIGLLIPMSFQLLIALPLAWLFKASKIAAALFTLITNPVTVFVIYPFQIYVGNFLLTGKGLSQERIQIIFAELTDLFALPDWGTLLTFQWWGDYLVRWGELITGVGLMEIVLPFFVAGFLFGVILAIPLYFIMLVVVKKYHKMRKQHRLLKMNAKRGLENETKNS